MKKMNILFLGLYTLLSLNSCATMVGDNSRTVCFQTKPDGAGIFVDNQRIGTTTASVTLPTYIYGGKVVVVKKDGYHDQAVFLNTKFQLCGLWNFLFWPGFVIDAASGNCIKLDPSQRALTLELQPLG